MDSEIQDAQFHHFCLTFMIRDLCTKMIQNEVQKNSKAEYFAKASCDQGIIKIHYGSFTNHQIAVYIEHLLTISHYHHHYALARTLEWCDN